ncbi:DNA topoisomerase I [Candidatus Nitrosocosmicus franklandus]|uniref:DNA topoisomerase 1 n=1 Tax=Candidatus Nitrosocosmicus franklandianus TaxID=1798806 RepID=A0A484I3T2_9ARCH|nr:DNA topoisomerase I [Candidatus Nitrosocosmicus franklandus]VFJ12416.1 DNA topoisomerase IB [Candidatus Nitrosocosmicus franklandus]
MSSISISSGNKISGINQIKGIRKWNTLYHNGVCFPPEYEFKGLTFKIRGEIYPLNRDQEELVYAWAKKKDTHYVKDLVFQQNFLSDFKKLLPKDVLHNVTSIEDLDFREFYSYVDEEKRKKEREKQAWRELPREEKKKITLEKKKEKEKLKNFYGKAVVDGIEVDVANWLVEPPGLFMGRGQHPLRGRWKPRVRPEEVILNLGEDANVPEGPWQKIIHDHSSTWLASWVETLTGKRKYVWLHDSASIRQNNDKAKYDKAMNLEKYIDKIENEIIRRMGSTDPNQRKVSTVCYLINKLAMRVGDEKDPDEADTVGASTLRKEHITFGRDPSGNKVLEFSFLGKDSVPWKKSILIDSPDKLLLYKNLELFLKNKKYLDPVFDNINSMRVNAFLRNLDPKNVPGLTAKVFRTYIATNTVKESLRNPPIKLNKDSSEFEKTYVAKYANLQAAITCNHKKGVDPKNPNAILANQRFEESIEKKISTIKSLKEDLRSKKWKNENQRKKLVDRIQKLEFQLRLQRDTREYNLGTSLRNYIDPRVYRSWMNIVGLEWKKLYTSTLQRKFLWVDSISKKELKSYFTV